MPCELVTLGEAMVLLLADDGRPLSNAEHFVRSVAGAETNVAVALARLGHRPAWIGRVGDDPFGHYILRRLRGEGVDVTHAVIDGQAPTGLLVRDVFAERPIDVRYYRAGSAGSRLHPDDIHATTVASAQCLLVTGITAALSESAREAVHAAVNAARSAGTRVLLDPNVRLRLAPPSTWRTLLTPLVEQADVVLAGADEAQLITGAGNIDDVIARLRAAGVAEVVLKHGRHGVSAAAGNDRWTVPARPVTAVDPVGAGDAFNAGFLSARLSGLDLPEALERGAAVAAACVQVRGDLEGLPFELPDDATQEIKR